jgi:hypothetical protein
MTAVSHACPMCKDSIPSSDAQQAGSLPSGFNNSVYLMLVGFLTVLGTMIGLIIKAVRDTGVKPGFQVIPRDQRPTRTPIDRE